MKPENVCTLIGACAVLHNISVKLNDDIGDNPCDDDQPDQDSLLLNNICNTFF